MHCPVCHTENAGEAKSCSKCGNGLQAAAPERRPARGGDKRRPNRRRSLPEENDSPFSSRAEGTNRDALQAYRLSIYSLIPGVGLFLGPVAAVWARRAWQRGLLDPSFTAHHPARAALVLGTAVTLTQWLGLALMIWGLWQHAAAR
jgi:hypothetical protein